MCLDVEKSHVRKPIPEMVCYKILKYLGAGVWATPYQEAPVIKGSGWFMPKTPAKRKVREYRKGEAIEGGYIHAYTSPSEYVWWSGMSDAVYDKLPSRPKTNSCYRFRCVARDIVALGDECDNDLVCRALYIPAFDVTGKNRNAILDM